MKSTHLIAAALATFVCTAGAQTLKPGLWEVTHKMSGGQMDQSMTQMQKQMASMPPEQRKMMEDMMAKQGVKPGGGTPGGGMSVKICMTKEMVERNEVPSQQGDCKTTHQTRSGGSMKFAYACGNPPSAGEGQMTFISPEAYEMKMVMTSQVHGKPDKTNMEGSGKWLGADCGKIKPVAALPKK